MRRGICRRISRWSSGLSWLIYAETNRARPKTIQLDSTSNCSTILETSGLTNNKLLIINIHLISIRRYYCRRRYISTSNSFNSSILCKNYLRREINHRKINQNNRVIIWKINLISEYHKIRYLKSAIIDPFRSRILSFK